MIPYIIVLILFLIGFRAKREKVFFVICAMSMLLIVALRAPFVGTDTQTYIKYFQSYVEVLHPTEPLWDNYVNFVRTITQDSQVFLAITACITLIPLFILIYKKKSLILLSLFIYFILPSDQGFIFSMTGMRQALVITIVLWMYDAFEKKKWLWVIILAVMSFLIHNSSVIAIIGMLLVQLFNFNRTSIVVVLSLSMFIMSFSFKINDAFSLISNTRLMGLAFVEDYSIYKEYMSNEYTISFFDTFNLIMPLLMMSVLIVLNPSVLKTMYAKLYVSGTALMSIFSGVPMIGRYFVYFIVSEIFIMPKVYESKEFKYNKVLSSILVIYQLVILFLYLYFNNRNGIDFNLRRVTPYRFFFESISNF